MAMCSQYVCFSSVSKEQPQTRDARFSFLCSRLQNVECGKAVKKVHTCIRVCSVERLSVTIYPFTRKLQFIYLSDTLRNLSKTATDLAVMVLLFFCFKG